MTDKTCTIASTDNSPCTPCDNGCPLTLNDFCVMYSGDTLTQYAIKNGDKLSDVLKSIFAALSDNLSANFTPLSVATAFTDSSLPEQPLTYSMERNGFVTIRGRLVIASQINTGTSKNIMSNSSSNLLPASIIPKYNQRIISASSAGTIYELQVFNTGYFKVYAISGNMAVASYIDINLRYNIN